MLANFLRAFGLSAKESDLFQLCLRYPTQPASFLAKHIELPRNTVRGILDGLVEKGLLIRSRRANAQLYTPEDREGLRRLILSRREIFESELSSQLALLEESKAELSPSRQTRPHIRICEGYEGIKRVYEDTLTAENGICSWASFDVNQQHLPTYFRNYYRRRANRKILMRSIHPDTPLARAHFARGKEEYREAILVDAQRFNILPEVQVYNDKVNIVSFTEKLGIIIESHELALAFRAIFELCFDSAAKNSSPRTKKRSTKRRRQ